MGSSRKTTNYQLSQFTGADKPDWLTDYNDDMSKIDTAMYANQESSGEHGAAIEALQTEVQELQKDVNDNMGDISGLQADVLQNTNNIDTLHHESAIHESEITALQQELTGYGRKNELYVLVGASYAMGSDGTVNTGIFNGFISAMNINKTQATILAAGGVGIAKTVAGVNFTTLVENSVVNNPSAVKHVVIANLANDVGTSTQDYLSAASALNATIRRKFPNAKIYVAWCSNTLDAQSRQNQLRFFNNQVKACKGFGWSIIEGSDTWAYRKEYFQNDGIHLTDSGYNYLGQALAVGVQTGIFLDFWSANITYNSFVKIRENDVISSGSLLVNKYGGSERFKLSASMTLSEEITITSSLSTSDALFKLQPSANFFPQHTNLLSLFAGYISWGENRYSCNIGIDDEGNVKITAPITDFKIPVGTAFGVGSYYVDMPMLN